jgi:hypothetical protein
MISHGYDFGYDSGRTSVHRNHTNPYFSRVFSLVFHTDEDYLPPGGHL